MLDSLRPVLVSHLGEGHAGLVGGLALGTEVHPRVALDPDEVVTLGGPHEPVLEDLLGGGEHLLTARVGHHLVHGQGQAHGKFTGSRPQGLDRQAMGPDHGVVHGEVPDEVVLHPGGRGAEGVAHHADEVDLVDRARPPDEVAQTGGDPGDEAGEHLGGVGGLRPTPGGQPGRRGEVMEGDDRRDVPLAARPQIRR